MTHDTWHTNIIVLVLLSELVKRFSVSRMHDLNKQKIISRQLSTHHAIFSVSSITKKILTMKKLFYRWNWEVWYTEICVAFCTKKRLWYVIYMYIFWYAKFQFNKKKSKFEYFWSCLRLSPQACSVGGRWQKCLLNCALGFKSKI